MTTDVERLDENAKDMSFLLYCLIVVMLIPLGFLWIITTSDKLSPDDTDDSHSVEENTGEDGQNVEGETQSETKDEFKVGWTVLDIDSFA